jgi:hypothetical protein
LLLDLSGETNAGEGPSLENSLRRRATSKTTA